MTEISVIIPAYNAANTIIHCIESIAKCNVANYEVIVIDDVSTDDTYKKVTEFIERGNSFVRLYKNEINLGPSLSRRNGIKFSNGRLLAFVDADDFVEPFFLDELYNAQKERDADITVCDYYIVSNSGKRNIRKVVPEQLTIRKPELLLLPVDSFCICLVKRTLFRDVFFPNIRNGEDMAVIPQLLSKAENVAFVSKPLYNYIYYSNSLSNAFSKTKIDSLVESFDVINRSIGRMYPEEVEFLGIRNLLYGSMLAIFKFSTDRVLARKILDDFSEKYPNWINSKYIHKLPRYKRIVIHNAQKRYWNILRILSLIHTFLCK